MTFISLRVFSPGKFAEKLRESLPWHSVRFCGEIWRDFAENLCSVSQWVGKDQRFLHVDSEDNVHVTATFYFSLLLIHILTH